jgi:hypothetical protein
MKPQTHRSAGRSAFLLALLLTAPGAALSSSQPTTAEGKAWNFRVLLDDREIGRHGFTLSGTGTGRELRSEARFDVRVLFLSAYRYEHEALERWDGDCLRSLVARTVDNGQRQAVNAVERDGQLLVERANSRDRHQGCVMSFAYWNPRILAARQLLNSQTGELLSVTVTGLGEETIDVRGRPVVASRHRIAAPGLQVDLWYAGERWVALEAPTAGGRRLRYELI